MPIIGQTNKNIWTPFRRGRDPTMRPYVNSMAYSSGHRIDRKYHGASDSGSVQSVYNQIAVDCSQINIQHVRLNENDRYESTINDGLNRIFAREANIDQTGRAFIIDAVFSLLDEGCIAIVPTAVTGNPDEGDAFKVEEARVGKVVSWGPKYVMVEIYDDETGSFKQVPLPKRYIPIVENPFYQTMNTRNSTAQRLTKVLAQLDRANNSFNPSKLDLLIQLPYQLKSTLKKEQVEKRRKEIEDQLNGSTLGIGYIDGTEKVIQLNRSLENNLWTQAKELREELYNQLGFSQAIFDGSADEATTLNYYNRTIEPILSALTEEIERKWISKTARAQKQAIRFFRDPFKLVPVQQLAEISDKLTRNEIMSSNEIRAILGMKPDDNPKSDELINANLNHPEEEMNQLLGGGSSIETTETSSVDDLLSKVGSKSI